MSARETERFHNEGKLEVGVVGMKAAGKKREEHFHAQETFAFRRMGMKNAVSEREPTCACDAAAPQLTTSLLFSPPRIPHPNLTQVHLCLC